MTRSGQQKPDPYQAKALEHAENAEGWLRNRTAPDPATTAATLAIYYQLRSITEDPDMAEAMRELAAALRQNSAAREEFQDRPRG